MLTSFQISFVIVRYPNWFFFPSYIDTYFEKETEVDIKQIVKIVKIDKGSKKDSYANVLIGKILQQSRCCT